MYCIFKTNFFYVNFIFKIQLHNLLDQMEDRSLLTLERVPSSPLSLQELLTKSSLV